MFAESYELGVRIPWDVAVGAIDRHVDGDRAADRFHVVDELKQLLVGVVAVLVGDGGVEGQINGQETMPLDVVDELGVGHVETGFLASFAELAVGGDDDVSLAGRIDKIGSDLAVFEKVDFARVVILDGTAWFDRAGGTEFGSAEGDDRIGVAGAAGVDFLLPGGICLGSATVEPPAVEIACPA